MAERMRSNVMMMLLGGALVMGGYLIGAGQSASTAVAQAANQTAAPADRGSGTVGVSIPSGGSAVVKGKDGYAYVIDQRGLFIKAAKSGKYLQLD